jgi:hypothetical protein
VVSVLSKCWLCDPHQHLVPLTSPCGAGVISSPHQKEDSWGDLVWTSNNPSPCWGSVATWQVTLKPGSLETMANIYYVAQLLHWDLAVTQPCGPGSGSLIRLQSIPSTPSLNFWVLLPSGRSCGSCRRCWLLICELSGLLSVLTWLIEQCSRTRQTPVFCVYHWTSSSPPALPRCAGDSLDARGLCCTTPGGIHPRQCGIPGQSVLSNQPSQIFLPHFP